MERKLTLILTLNTKRNPKITRLLNPDQNTPKGSLAILLWLINKNCGINVVFKAYAFALVYLLRDFPNNLDQSIVSTFLN